MYSRGMFKNKRVLVTGSGRGIGKGIAEQFAREGAWVQLVARSEEELEATRSELLKFTAEVRATSLDLLGPASGRQIVEEVQHAWGGLDILVTNAGAAAQGGFLELEDAVWPIGFGLKMFGNLRVIRHAWPLLQASNGHLVMIGGGTARTPDRQRRVDQAPTAREALREAIALQAMLKPELRGVATALDVLRRTDPAADAAWKEREHARLQRCETVVTRLHAEGDLAAVWDVRTAARLLWAATSQRVWDDLVVDQGWSTGQYRTHLTVMLESALLTATR